MTVRFSATQWPYLNNRGCNPRETEQKNEFDWMPDCIGKQMGHFNVFRLEPCAGDNDIPVPYVRPGFYRILLIIGTTNIHTSDNVKAVENKSLAFYTPWIPGKSEYAKTNLRGYCCIFSPDFFLQYKNFNHYEVFRPHGIFVIDLTKEQANILAGYYERMLTEIDSNYIYKYDVLRNLVYEVLHFAIKQQSKRDLTR